MTKTPSTSAAASSAACQIEPRICWLDNIGQQELNPCDGNSLRSLSGASQTKRADGKCAKGKGLSMRSLKLSVLDVLDDLRTSWFARPAAETEGHGSPAFS